LQNSVLSKLLRIEKITLRYFLEHSVQYIKNCLERNSDSCRNLMQNGYVEIQSSSLRNYGINLLQVLQTVILNRSDFVVKISFKLVQLEEASESYYTVAFNIVGISQPNYVNYTLKWILS
jgi:hypothetical protein